MTKKILFILSLAISSTVVSQTYFPFKKNEKWGIYNKVNKEIHLTDFDSIATFSQYYNEDFTDDYPFAIAYSESYKKIINNKGEVLLDSLVKAKEIRNELFDLILKSNVVLPFYKYSKSNSDLFGFYYPTHNHIVVPDKYNRVNFYFDKEDEHRMYYYGYNSERKTLDIFNVTDEKLVKSIKCSNYKFDSQLLIHYEDRPESLYLMIIDGDQKSVIDFKGNEILPNHTYININFNSEAIIADDKVFDLKGNFIRKTSSEDTDDEEEVYEGFRSSADYSDYNLTDLGNNNYHVKHLDKEFKVKSNWTDIKLFFDTRRSEKVQYLSFSQKGKYGVYDIINEKTIIKPKHQSIVLDYFDVSNNYTHFDALPKERYQSERETQLFSVKNKDEKFNYFDPIKEQFIFENWFDNISIFRNYDYVSFQDFFIINDNNTYKLYDLNGNMILDNVSYLSKGNEYFTYLDNSHKVSWFENILHLDRYIYVIYKNGNSGYMVIDNEAWKVIHLYPFE